VDDVGLDPLLAQKLRILAVALRDQPDLAIVALLGAQSEVPEADVRLRCARVSSFVLGTAKAFMEAYLWL